MILKLFPLSLLFVTVAFANSMGWPIKKELPNQLSVTIDIPPTWGSEFAVDAHSSFRVNVSNKRNADLHLLNVSFIEPRFLLIKEDGSEVQLDVPIKNLKGPESNPGITLGPSSGIGFKVEMDRPVSPVLTAGTVMLEVKITFVAGDIVEDQDGKSGYLDGFNYTIVRRLSGADRLFKLAKTAEQDGGGQPATRPESK